MAKLTHINSRGEAEMVDVSSKDVTARIARATGEVVMAEATLEAIQNGGISKGDVFAVARIAGIQAAKRTSDLIPLCHPLPLSKVTVEFLVLSPTRLGVVAECKVASQTGVEMEALTAASIAALTIYDMCKAIDRGMTIEAIRLEHKSGGKSGTWERA